MSLEFGFGISTKSDPVEAGRSVASGAIRKIRSQEPTLALLFVSASYDAGAVVRGVKDILGPVPLYGITTAGEIYNRNYDDSVLLFLIASRHILIDPFLITGLDTNARAARDVFDELSRTLSPEKVLTTPCFVLGMAGVELGATRHPLRSILEICLEEGVHLPSVLAFELGRISPPGSGRIIMGDTILTDAFLGLAFRSEVGFDTLSDTACLPTEQFLTVTGCNQKMVKTLDGISSWDAYCRALGIPPLPPSQWQEVMVKAPLALTGLTGHEIIFPRQVTGDGTFVFDYPLTKGTSLRIMEPPKDPKLLVSLVEHARQRGKIVDPAFCFTFKTPSPGWIGQKLKVQDPEIQAIPRSFPSLPLVGCYVETILAGDHLGGLTVRDQGGAVALFDRALDPTVETIKKMETLLSSYQTTTREVQSRISELTNLYRITQNMTETIDLQRILRLILEGITNELGYDRVSLCLLKGKKLTGKMTIGHEHLQGAFTAKLSDKKNFMIACLDRKSPIVMEAPYPPDTMPAQLGEELQDSVVACIPLLAHGKPLGIIVVDNRFSDAPITIEGIRSLVTLANTAAAAIDNSLMHEKVTVLNRNLKKKVDLSYEALQQTNRELEESKANLQAAYDNIQAANRELDQKISRLSLLNEISRSFVSVHNLDQLLHMLLQAAIKELQADRGSIMLIQPETGELTIRVGIGISPDAILKYRMKVDEGIAGTVVREKRPILVRDASRDPRFVFISNRRHNNSLIAVPLIVKGEALGVINIENNSTSRVFDDKDLEFLEILSSQGSITIANAQLFEKLQKNYFDTVLALSTAVEAKDPYTLGHSKRVTEYCIALADEFGLSPEEVQHLKFGAILHDVGKIGVAGSILNKPDRLTETEFDSIKAHSIIGENIVKEVDFLQPVRPLIRHHQERWDGSGYPDGLTGETIPFLACIIAVADVFDALMTDRPYRRAYQHHEAIGMIESEAGKQLHPRVVEAFLKIFR